MNKCLVRNYNKLLVRKKFKIAPRHAENELKVIFCGNILVDIVEIWKNFQYSVESSKFVVLHVNGINGRSVKYNNILSNRFQSKKF